MPVGGIIPARAGFTPLDLPSRQEYLDHPRSRGVYALMLPGSWSPHWIIPARAGFTTPSSRRRSAHRDHPRSRGVYGAVRRRGRRDPGSSPLARGLHPRFDRPGYCGRIIPARAGFTTASTDRPRSGPDHPRSRGVYSHRVTAERVMRGSSPLARGLQRRRPANALAGGIIPARAGFTRVAGARLKGRPDHPRSRGVYRARPARPRRG